MIIPKIILEDMINQSLDETPLEACGYLAGTNGIVDKNYRMTNVDHSPTHFSFDPEEQFKVLKAARQQKIDLIGIYHSHPASQAKPSVEDIKLAFDPDISYVIISLEKKPFAVKSFKIKKGKVIPENVELI